MTGKRQGQWQKFKLGPAPCGPGNQGQRFMKEGKLEMTVIFWEHREKGKGIPDKTEGKKRWGTKTKGAGGYWRANQCEQSGRFMSGSSSKRRS